jgi:hypothetical protein
MPLSRRLPLIILGILAYAPAHAAKEPEADPAVYLQAFNDTCRRGFPDLEAIAANAIAHGWIERTMRPVSGAVDPLRPELGRALNKDGLMLFLNAPGQGNYKTVCQVTGSARTSLNGRDVAAVVSPSLKAGEPVLGPGNPKEDDYARWTVAPGITVQAGIGVYRRRVRSLSIAVRQDR